MIAKRIVQILNVDTCSIYLLNRQKKALGLATISGVSVGEESFVVPVGLTILALVSRGMDWSLVAEYTGWFYDYGWFTGSFLGGLIYYFAALSGARSSS